MIILIINCSDTEAAHSYLDREDIATVDGVHRHQPAVCERVP